MKQAEIKNLSAEDLQAQLAQTTAEYQRIKLAHKISPVENPMQIKNMRRTIARLNTELSSRQQ